MPFSELANQYIRISGGTTAERPSAPQPGMIRFNTSDPVPFLEFYNGSNWVRV